jgi:hypothetical protein
MYNPVQQSMVVGPDGSCQYEAVKRQRNTYASVGKQHTTFPITSIPLKNFEIHGVNME